MTELTQAILDGNITRVRALVRDTPSLLSEPSSNGTLPLDLAREKGRLDVEVTLVMAGAPTAQPLRPAGQLLEMALSELSEDHARAGWIVDLEYLVWTSVVGAGAEIVEHDTFGLGRLGRDVASELGELANRAGGWVAWDSESHAPALVTMETWLNKYDQWRKALALREARA